MGRHAGRQAHVECERVYSGGGRVASNNNSVGYAAAACVQVAPRFVQITKRKKKRLFTPGSNSRQKKGGGQRVYIKSWTHARAHTHACVRGMDVWSTVPPSTACLPDVSFRSQRSLCAAGRPGLLTGGGAERQPGRSLVRRLSRRHVAESRVGDEKL